VNPLIKRSESEFAELKNEQNNSEHSKIRQILIQTIKVRRNAYKKYGSP